MALSRHQAEQAPDELHVVAVIGNPKVVDMAAVAAAHEQAYEHVASGHEPSRPLVRLTQY